MDSDTIESIVIFIIMLVGMVCIIIWGVTRNQSEREKHEQEMTESRKMRTALSYDEIMERFREVGTDVDGILERLEKDITDPEFLPTSEQGYVDALAARYQNAGYKIISKNCGSPGADIIMRRDGHKIIIDTSFSVSARFSCHCERKLRCDAIAKAQRSNLTRQNTRLLRFARNDKVCDHLV